MFRQIAWQRSCGPVVASVQSTYSSRMAAFDKGLARAPCFQRVTFACGVRSRSTEKASHASRQLSVSIRWACDTSGGTRNSRQPFLSERVSAPCFAVIAAARCASVATLVRADPREEDQRSQTGWIVAIGAGIFDGFALYPAPPWRPIKRPQPRTAQPFRRGRQKGAHHIRTTVHRGLQPQPPSRIACRPFLRRAQIRPARPAVGSTSRGFDRCSRNACTPCSNRPALCVSTLHGSNITCPPKDLAFNALSHQGFFDLCYHRCKTRRSYSRDHKTAPAPVSLMRSATPWASASPSRSTSLPDISPQTVGQRPRSPSPSRHSAQRKGVGPCVSLIKTKNRTAGLPQQADKAD